MGYRHLTDTELQHALDGTLRSEQPLLQLHLESCEYCRGRKSDYHELAVSLSRLSGVPVSPAVAETIMSRIESRTSLKAPWSTVASWAAVAIAGAAPVVWILGRTGFSQTLQDFTVVITASISQQAGKLSPLASDHALMVAGIASVCIMMAIDRVVRRRPVGLNLFSI